MFFQVNSKDDVGLLTESSIYSTAFNTHRSSDVDPSDDATDHYDTVHYLSPASTAARTEHEGDLEYQQFFLSPLYQSDVTYKPGLDTILTSSTSLSCEENSLQRTVAIIKPDAMCYKDVVLRAINKAGLKIVNQRLIHLTPEQVSEIYEKYYGTPAFPHMVVTVSISPVLVLSLQAINAVEKWNSMVGPMGTLREEWFFPYSVRTRFGLLGDFPNVLHASEGLNAAQKENRYFYPRHIQEPLPVESDKVKDYISTFVRPTLLQGLAEIVKTKPIDPVISLAEWLLLHNPYQPHLPNLVAMTPT
ncbi:hypothetical protein ABEB36_005354 [Hypothenemus hampei]|uniref:Nucleoside diphosphate kinase-like domain-containing protein n=1 Tax=Hypothenemus hampei TaxID=57062 RepID=A0ABD1EXY1_HYPHA